MRIAAVLRQTLESGYTTVRDAGGLAAGFRDAVDEGLAPGPRLQVALNIISPTGGIGDHVSASGYGHPAPPDPALPPGVANGPDAMRAKVREMVQHGRGRYQDGDHGRRELPGRTRPKGHADELAPNWRRSSTRRTAWAAVSCVTRWEGRGCAPAWSWARTRLNTARTWTRDPDLLALMAEQRLLPGPHVRCIHLPRHAGNASRARALRRAQGTSRQEPQPWPSRRA